jgi:hypothetical protein
MDSLYTIIFYPITFILSLFSTNHITSCLGSRIDMVSILDRVSMIFALSLFNKYLATLAKCLGNTIINIYRNYDGFYIRSALNMSRCLVAGLKSHDIKVLFTDLL